MVKKVYERNDRQYRIRNDTMRLINKLDKSRTKTPNQKIFDLMSELERLRQYVERPWK